MKERRETYNKQQVYAKKKKKLPTPLLPYSLLSALSANTHTHSTHTPPLAYISRQQLS